MKREQVEEVHGTHAHRLVTAAMSIVQHVTLLTALKSNKDENKHLLLLFAALLLIPLAASAEAVEIDGIYYNLNADTEQAEVTSNPDQYYSSVNIPSSVTDGGVSYSVTSIGKSAFNGCSGLTSVTIPNSVTSIGSGAFSGCI